MLFQSEEKATVKAIHRTVKSAYNSRYHIRLLFVSHLFIMFILRLVLFRCALYECAVCERVWVSFTKDGFFEQI